MRRDQKVLMVGTVYLHRGLLGIHTNQNEVSVATEQSEDQVLRAVHRTDCKNGASPEDMSKRMARQLVIDAWQG